MKYLPKTCPKQIQTHPTDSRNIQTFILSQNLFDEAETKRNQNELDFYEVKLLLL